MFSMSLGKYDLTSYQPKGNIETSLKCLLGCVYFLQGIDILVKTSVFSFYRTIYTLVQSTVSLVLPVVGLSIHWPRAQITIEIAQMTIRKDSSYY